MWTRRRRVGRPGGKHLVVERGGAIVTVRADGIGERRLAAGWEPAWSPGGRRVAFSDGDDLHVVPVRGGRPEALTSTPAHAPGRFLNEPRRPVFKGYCERGRPEALTVYQGTSVGYTDRYPRHFHGQNLDLTGLAAGTYVLVHRANRSLLVRELRYENNAASVRIRIAWPTGRGGPPSVRILRRCPDSDRC